ncbi:murein L,D-transpeptidase catalytic domain family protein [Flavobacterium sufflavum]|uniref:Murein L,D-transpeptidase catalytic domain family protein n=1 Tax=Flavobacterium sufflavum TaxID=1921138 RepID=A0A3S2ULX6_9FLAO|nr:murein L,D-transpeptidase catalytic domain family protein [Flavobacterium sufflavum]RVT78669.1 murein L,D-transpeptidase catalytic domain family protein [Flavobacterium sufflavum]
MVYNGLRVFLVLVALFVSTNVFFSKEKANATVLKSNVERVNVEPDIEEVYNKLHSANYDLPKLESFKEALEGFYKLKNQGLVSKNIITLIDFSLSANTKRLWVIDLDTNSILLHSLVAHGRNTGDEYANSFSNAPESYKSSLGFYVTGEVYNGKHGKSLKLDGLEKGINDNARDRAVVVHGADYVSNSFIQNNKRLGRSLGCPAIPLEITDELISTIKDKSCLFIYYPSESYKRSSKLIS